MQRNSEWTKEQKTNNITHRKFERLFFPNVCGLSGSASSRYYNNKLFRFADRYLLGRPTGNTGENKAKQGHSVGRSVNGISKDLRLGGRGDGESKLSPFSAIERGRVEAGNFFVPPTKP